MWQTDGVAPTMASEREWDVDDLLIEMLHPEWHKQAACRGMDPAVFFPERSAPELVRAALRVCANCPVKSECADAGQEHNQGVWGGTSPAMRRRQRRRRMER